MDRRHKLVRRYHVSDAAEHDSQVLDDILDGQHGFGCVGGQRLPLGGDRGVAEGEGVAEPDPSQGPPQPAERAREARQQDPLVGSGPRHVFGAQSNDMGGTLACVVSGWCGRRRGSG